MRRVTDKLVQAFRIVADDKHASNRDRVHQNSPFSLVTSSLRVFTEVMDNTPFHRFVADDRVDGNQRYTDHYGNA